MSADRPPRVAVWLLGRLLPAGERDAVLGDLEERWRIRRDRSGAGAAGAWYVRRALVVPLWLLRSDLSAAAAAAALGARSAVRGLLRTPRVSALMVLTLTLGIGGTTAVFSVVDGVLLESLPYPEPARLVTIAHRGPGGHLPEWIPHSTAAHVVYQDGARTFESMAVYERRQANVLVAGTQPVRVDIVAGTRSLFEVLRVRPVLGRIYSEEEDLRGGARVAVLSHGFWQSHFGGDTKAIGRTVEVNGSRREIVGVMPPGFGFPAPDVSLWVPLQLDRSDLGGFNISGIARLAAGVTVESAERDLARVFPGILEVVDFFPAEVLDVVRPLVRPYVDEVVGDVRTALWVVFATVGFVLLIACANVSNLLLARIESRRAEISVRTAMGAGRAHLFGLFVAEGGVLALTAGVLGLGLAHLSVPAFLRLAADTVPRVDEIGIDATVLACTFVTVSLTTLLFALVPLLHSRGVSAAGALREGARGTTGDQRANRARQLLVVTQVGFALVLLVGSGLTLRSFVRLYRIDPGFAAENVLSLRVALPLSDYPDDESVAAFHHRMIERLEALPGAEAAGVTSQLPLAGYLSLIDPLSIDGRPWRAGEIPPLVEMRAATEGYFEALRIPIVSGRVLTRTDAEGRSGGVLITEKVVRTFFGGADPIGARVAHGLRGQPGEREWSDVVGVVGDIRGVSLTEPPMGAAYYPLMDRPGVDMAWLGRSVAYVVRTTVPPLALAPAIRKVFAEADPRLPLADLRTLDTVVSDARASMTFTMTMLALAAAMGLLIGAVGLYGVIAYVTERRTREIGVRLALCARPATVLRMVMAQGTWTAAFGVVLGLAAALLLSGYVAPLLYEVDARDPLTFAAVAVLLLAVSILATWLPARRAARMDPARALREPM